MLYIESIVSNHTWLSWHDQKLLTKILKKTRKKKKKKEKREKKKKEGDSGGRKRKRQTESREKGQKIELRVLKEISIQERSEERAERSGIETWCKLAPPVRTYYNLVKFLNSFWAQIPRKQHLLICILGFVLIIEKEWIVSGVRGQEWNIACG